VVIVEAVAVRFQVLPEVIDLSLIPTGCGVGAMLAAFAGAFARFEPDRLGRFIMFGNLAGGALATLFLLGGILGVFS
jgi:hypothetical protein